jgi:histidine ammonia-lyase
MPSNTVHSDVSAGLHRLSVEDVVRVARDRARVTDLAPEVEERMKPAADWVASTVEQITGARSNGLEPKSYYGINTGFGA